MKTITIKNISKAYDDTLFEGVSFSIKRGDRIAVVGHNGQGKSTLLKIIAGSESCDTGRVIKEPMAISYIPQEFVGDTALTIASYLSQQKAKPAVHTLLKQFAVLPKQPFETTALHTLSEGQKRVLEIAAVLSQSPAILCIDEPENHLDMKSRMLLTKLLTNYWGAVVFVSHDRYLVDAVSNQIILLKHHTSTLVSNKTYAELQEAERLATDRLAARQHVERKALDKLESSVKMLRHRTTYNDTQAKTYQMKKRQLAERKAELQSQPNPNPKALQLHTHQVDQKSGKLIFQTDSLGLFRSPTTEILKNVTVDMRFGERVVLLGSNGSGKTSFIKLLQQELQPTSGKLKLGIDLRIGCIDQYNTLDLELSPLEHFYQHGFTEEQARSMLASFLFTQQQAKTALKILSGGQQHRFRFLLLFKTKPEFIILDEPTNNLDPEAWDLLVNLVHEFNGSLLLVSHDRAFVEQIENKRLWFIQNKTITESWLELDEAIEKFLEV